MLTGQYSFPFKHSLSEDLCYLDVTDTTAVYPLLYPEALCKSNQCHVLSSGKIQESSTDICLNRAWYYRVNLHDQWFIFPNSHSLYLGFIPFYKSNETVEMYGSRVSTHSSIKVELRKWLHLHTFWIRLEDERIIADTFRATQLCHQCKCQNGKQWHTDNMTVECQVHECHRPNPWYFYITNGRAINSSGKVKSVMASLWDVLLHVKEESNLEKPSALQNNRHAQHYIHQKQFWS